MTEFFLVNDELVCFFFFSSRRRHTISYGDWSSDVCSSDLEVRDRGGDGDDYRDLERLGILLRKGENSQRQGRDVPRDVHDRGGDRWGERHEHRSREAPILLLRCLPPDFLRRNREAWQRGGSAGRESGRAGEVAATGGELPR